MVTGPTAPSSLEQLERLVDFSPLVGGQSLTSLREIRARQDAHITERISRNAMRAIPEAQLNSLKNSDFFVGSVDFMVQGDPRSYIVLETNGGSNRGYTSLAEHNMLQLCNGYVEMLSFIQDATPLIVIGHPNKDPLLIEKIFLAEHIGRALVDRGLSERVHVSRLDGFRGVQKEGEATILIDSYDRILPPLLVAEGHVILNGQPVDAVIGDGVARRHRQLSDGGPYDVILANWTFPVTDDKYMTYRAVKSAKDILEPYQIKPLEFWRANTVDELVELCEELRQDTDLVIKPFQGSGGAGVHPIDTSTHIPVVVEESLGEFRAKFGPWRNPFPYTICEKVESHRANWRDSRRNFDVRIYLARDGDQLVPVGGLFRIALEPDTGETRKRSMVVNLSGYGGIDLDRGLGLSEESLNVVRLEQSDLVQMFAGATVLMAYIAANHGQLIDLSDQVD